MRTGTVLVGDSTRMDNPILFPRGLKINNGDPLVMETVQGVRLPGQVTAVNQTPYSLTRNLSGYQAIEVMVFDHQGILQPNLPVKIILPKDDEKQKILDALTQAAKGSQYHSDRRFSSAPAAFCGTGSNTCFRSDNAGCFSYACFKKYG